MSNFLKEIIKWEKFELLIDKNLFNKDIVFKAAYNFLDKGYFFFKLDDNWDMFLEFTKKSDVKINPEEVILEFSDELLSVYLRDKLEKENKDIREKIVWAAIANSIDSTNYTEFNTDSNFDQNQIDFDKDIDDILKEIENDPELKIDEEEIERILKEIEEETKEDFEEEKTSIPLNINNIENAKKMFQDR